MRKSLTLVLFFGMPALAQVQGGHETVQDAIRFERQKDAAAARQATIENRRAANSTAERAVDEGNRVGRTTKARKGNSGSAERDKGTSPRSGK